MDCLKYFHKKLTKKILKLIFKKKAKNNDLKGDQSIFSILYTLYCVKYRVSRNIVYIFFLNFPASYRSGNAILDIFQRPFLCTFKRYPILY